MNYSSSNFYWILFIIFLVIIFVSCILSFYNSKTEFFNTATSQSSTSTPNIVPTDEITLYYALWCGYSKMFLPEWNKFTEYAKKNFPNLKVSSIRCEGVEEKQCQIEGIQGYPTVIFKSNNKPVPFNEARSCDNLINFVKKYHK